MMEDWFGNNARDGYSAKPYEYKPKWEKLVERHPDKRPSDSPQAVIPAGDRSIWVLEVRRHGFLVISAGGLSLFNRDEM